MARKSKDGDGRRNNRPPEHGMIRKDEVRNPFGRGGKPPVRDLTETERAMLAEAERIVSHDEDGPVTARRRAVQNWTLNALMSQDPKVHEHFLRYVSSIEAAQGERDQKALEWFFFAKACYAEQFYRAKKRGVPPPDVAHPEHIDIVDGQLVITGPLEPEAREHWEIIKANLIIYEWRHKCAREAARIDPCEDHLNELEAVVVWRRKLMRRVPKGWNWRENIYCLHGMHDEAHKVIKQLEAHRADAS